MQHVLDISHEELERTHRLVETYKPIRIKSIFFSFFPNSFKKIFQQYAEVKEELVLEYQELYNAIASKRLDFNATEKVKEELDSIHILIEKSSKLLSRLVAHGDIQENILIHEKTFFLKLLESFQGDILLWVWSHEEKSFGNTDISGNNSENIHISETLKILENKKHKLEEYIKNNS